MNKILFLMISVNLFGFDNPCFERRNWEEVQCSFKKITSQAYKVAGEMQLSKNMSKREYDQEYNETKRLNGISLRKHNIQSFQWNIKTYKSNLEITKNNIKIFERRVENMNSIIKSYDVEAKSSSNKSESAYSKYKKRFVKWWNNDLKDSFKAAQIKMNQYLKENDLKTIEEIDLPKYTDGQKQREIKKKNAIKNLEAEIASEESNIKSANSDILKYLDLIVHSEEMIAKWNKEIIDLNEKEQDFESIEAEYAQYDKEGGEILNEISGDISSFFEDKNLNECQKACVVKCTTASYLTHQFGINNGVVDLSSGNNGVNTGIQEHGSFGLMMKERIGVCFDYAMLYTKLAVKNGLNAKSLESVRYKDKNGLDTGHAFNSVEIDGVKYLSEPQQSTCTFGLIPSS